MSTSSRRRIRKQEARAEAENEQPGTGKSKATGTKRRREAAVEREEQHWADGMTLLTYRPEQLLDPAALLSRFTEIAGELLAVLPAEQQPTSAEVTATLRQAVLEAFRTRDEYIARLVETDATHWSAKPSAQTMRRAIRSALIDTGLRVVEDVDEQELFVVVEGEGDTFEVVRPAYVDQATGKLILSGQLRRVPTPLPVDAPADASGKTSQEEDMA
ncbi:hypothetical protein [Streptomyces sp. NPDC059786]|uniref:hypothetical protein n=1 Tax=Streptomyces sp. NPDC059786 TaxID=3346946 RepID=UPI00365B7A20